jgi:hypothetical protein
VGALSPFNLANAVIGRAWTLMSINFGDARLGETFMASSGHNLNYNNMCCGENEELSVYEPFHVQMGFQPEQSVVSLFRGWSLLHFRQGPASEMAHVMKWFHSMRSSVTFVIDPLVAKGLKNEGFQTKQEVSLWLAQNAKMPVGQYWEGGSHLNYSTRLAARGVEPYATWAKLPKDALITPYSRPGDIKFIVVGGEMNPFWITTDFVYTQSASIDKWRPKDGIRRDAQPLRMPVAIQCSGGICGIPGNGNRPAAQEWEPEVEPEV